MTASAAALDPYRLDDRYRRTEGRVFMTGSQALVAIMLAQARADRSAGLDTRGFVSGYRGSPLGAVDQAMWRAQKFLETERITFLPAINEDLAATAILGAQQVELEPDRIADGVFAMWYGKGPGVDRAGDALKHGNAYGSSPNGGVLVVAGDDHGCASSSMSHQSDVAFMAWYMPTLNPSSLSEYVEFGLYGYALSRYSGMWVGFKAISETVESAASFSLAPPRRFVTPTDFTPPPGGLNLRWPDLPGMQIESRMRHKKEAVRAFARANPIDRAIFNVAHARYGIITTGKAHHDVMEALDLLGIDEARARAIGLDVYKIGIVWPVENRGAERFMAGKEEVLVVEEKRGIIESQLKEYLYDRASAKPRRILGKHDENGDPLISWVDEVSPSSLAPIIARRLRQILPDLDFSERLSRLERLGAARESPGGAKRVPYFCSGCPHSTSTRVPEGSRALAGIGCHFMASWMDRETSSLIQMGGEGVNWASKSMFLKDRPHIFQNLGDGTYYHSGSMAIRQAVAAGANITYKILYNDAVAMTGGQPIDGVLTVPQIAQQLEAEGVKKIAVVSDNPDAIVAAGGLPSDVSVHHRDALDTVQRDMREIAGVTAIIYEQACAAEKRRRRKKGDYPDPPQRIFINAAVCEGCGDCSTQSNCLSVVPIETELGRKRAIDQSSCNKDYSCVKGFCPSFVTVHGGAVRKPQPQAAPALEQEIARLPAPRIAPVDGAYDLLVAGVGGTGVVTIGAIITMAAHLEGKGASVLDFMGFAQKGGAVLSYVRLAPDPSKLRQVRIDAGEAEAVIACDLVVATDQRALVVMREGTRIIANTDIVPTADFIRDRNMDFEGAKRVNALRRLAGAANVVEVNAAAAAQQLLGDTVFSNMLMLGHAFQSGLVPVSQAALQQAIELNGVAAAQNLRAFALGRVAAHAPETFAQAIGAQAVQAPPPMALSDLIAHRAALLTAYQGKAYAARYRAFMDKVSARAEGIAGGPGFIRAVAENLAKLMAYKDEYEVARLYADGAFLQSLRRTFEGDFTLSFHLAPPVLKGELDAEGRPKKVRFGSWMLPAFSLLRHFRFLRGTPFDPFGGHPDRREERRLLAEYQARIEALLPMLDASNIAQMTEIATLPDQIRGYGPVKAKSVAAAEIRLAALLEKMDKPAAKAA